METECSPSLIRRVCVENGEQVLLILCVSGMVYLMFVPINTMHMFGKGYVGRGD